MTDVTPQGLAARGDLAALADVYWKLRSYAVHDDNCTFNRHPHYRGCSCGLTAALAKGEAAAARILAALEATPDAIADHPAVRALVEAERERIIASLKEEADLCPCAEDAVVIRDCACLIKANFSYDDAEAIRQGDTP